MRREGGDGFEINRRRKRKCFLTYVYSTKYVWIRGFHSYSCVYCSRIWKRGGVLEDERNNFFLRLLRFRN